MDKGLTTDKNDPLLKETNVTGQYQKYLVLSDEERKNGYIRPLRYSYVHKGIKYSDDIEILEEVYQYDGKEYVALVGIYDENNNKLGSKYLTERQLNEYNRNDGYIGGCGEMTTMVRPIAETYAKKPDFYSDTFCCGCGTHFPVNEFVWYKTDIVLGT